MKISKFIRNKKIISELLLGLGTIGIYYHFKNRKIRSICQSFENSSKNYISKGKFGVLTQDDVSELQNQVQKLINEFNNPKYKDTIVIMDDHEQKILREFVEMIRKYNEKLAQNKDINISKLKNKNTLKELLSDLNNQLEIQKDLLKKTIKTINMELLYISLSFTMCPYSSLSEGLSS
jgi:small-conductance mechanosensitive channel